VDKNRRPPYCCSCLRCCSYHFPLSRYCQGYTALIATLLTPLLERFSLNWKHFRRVGGRGAGQYHGVDTVHTYLINVIIMLVETCFTKSLKTPVACSTERSPPSRRLPRALSHNSSTRSWARGERASQSYPKMRVCTDYGWSIRINLVIIARTMRI